jgi:hypothetical protein
MTQFEIYTKVVTIGDSEYKIRPLAGRFLPKLYAVFAKVEAGRKGSGDDNFLQALDEQTIMFAHELSLETLKKSYPERDAALLDEFVSQNLWAVFGAVAEVNLNAKA